MNSKFWKYAGIRMIRTICQTMIATIGTSTMLEEVKWHIVFSTSLLAGILSLLTSIVTGLPEANDEEE
ncbi:holin [bacterium]|nr:holin [bacterium]